MSFVFALVLISFLSSLLDLCLQMWSSRWRGSTTAEPGHIQPWCSTCHGASSSSQPGNNNLRNRILKKGEMLNFLFPFSFLALFFFNFSCFSSFSSSITSYTCSSLNSPSFALTMVHTNEYRVTYPVHWRKRSECDSTPNGGQMGKTGNWWASELGPTWISTPAALQQPSPTLPYLAVGIVNSTLRNDVLKKMPQFNSQSSSNQQTIQTKMYEKNAFLCWPPQFT